MEVVVGAERNAWSCRGGHYYRCEGEKLVLLFKLGMLNVRMLAGISQVREHRWQIWRRSSRPFLMRRDIQVSRKARSAVTTVILSLHSNPVHKYPPS